MRDSSKEKHYLELALGSVIDVGFVILFTKNKQSRAYSEPFAKRSVLDVLQSFGYVSGKRETK